MKAITKIVDWCFEDDDIPLIGYVVTAQIEREGKWTVTVQSLLNGKRNGKITYWSNRPLPTTAKAKLYVESHCTKTCERNVKS